MPDIKHHFAGGKMNKDVDERLVPNGEYRSAMNIQVSTSENSDVGTVQNILGNERLYTAGIPNLTPEAVCVATIADEKNDAFYWYVTETTTTGEREDYTNGFKQARDLILRNKNNTLEYVFVDVKDLYVLVHAGSNMNPITGNIFISTQQAFDKIEVGDVVLHFDELGVTDPFYPSEFGATVLSKDPTNLSINVGNFYETSIVDALPGQPSLSMKIGKTKSPVLEFDSSKIITGLNIIDDMLFWTDGVTEPKKINITRSIQGTEQDGNRNTKKVNLRLQNPLGLITNNPNVVGIREVNVQKEEITVIKRSPLLKLDMDLLAARDPSLNYSAITLVAPAGSPTNSTFIGNSAANNIYDFAPLGQGDVFYIKMPEDINGNTSFELTDWAIGKQVVLSPEDINGNLDPVPLREWHIRGIIEEWEGNNFDTSNGDAQVKVKIITKNDQIPVVTGSDFTYIIDLLDVEEKLYEFKFPRFSYRYKYEDGEYSTFAPFTQVAFVPSSFAYHPKKGYNLGMTNTLKKVILKGWKNIIETTNNDVVSIDILYKEEDNPNIYVVDTIDPDAYFEPGNLNDYLNDEYIITSESIKGVLPSNQLLRSYDNVPKKALAQEVIGNRVVYGNYYQNFSLQNKDAEGREIHVPSFNISLQPNENLYKKSIKSLRDYQIGVVFLDEHGRETPIITNTTGSIKVGKMESNITNSIVVNTLPQGTPVDAKYFKFYIKETSTQYYNLAMDRYYDAADDNIWLSFNSNDRNKVDIDDFLILKKAAEKDTLVEDEARYKILAIENEAPDYIKTVKTLINTQTHHNTTNNYLDGASFVLPSEGSRFFELRYDGNGVSTPYSDSNIRELHENVTFPSDNVSYYISFGSTEGTAPTTTPIRIASMSVNNDNLTQAAKFIITLAEPFDSAINYHTDDFTGTNVNEFVNGTIILFYKYEIKNRPQFDGRFFVKIFNDDVFRQQIIANQQISVNYNVVASQKIFSFRKEAHALSWDLGDSCPNTEIDAGVLEYQHVSSYGNQGQAAGRYGGTNGILEAMDDMAKAVGVPCFMSTSTNCSRQWKPHAAFMRGRNIAQAGTGFVGQDIKNIIGTHGINERVSEINPHDLASDFNFQDVWFVDDAGHIEGKFHYGFNENANEGWDGKAGQGSDSSIGIDNLATGAVIDLNFGGLQRGDYIYPSFSPWAGTTGQNPTPTKNDSVIYDLENNDIYGDAWNIAKRLTPGQKFRFREDPTDTVYTINNIDNAFLARYNSNWENGGNTADSYVSGEDNWSIQQKNHYGDNISSYDTYNNVKYKSQVYFRPFNFTRRFRITLNKQLVWNPYGYNEEITNGLEITVTAAGSYSSGSVQLNDLQGTGTLSGNNVGTLTLSVGMVLHSINGTAVDDDKLVVVAKTDNSNDTIYLKKYRTDQGNVDVSGLSISSGNTLLFKQYSFNGISPNSVVNLNYHNDAEGWNGAKLGVDAVGYTIDFVEEELSEPEMPNNPAIWETEPKDDQDLDIYYEASDNIPVNLNFKESFINFPIGSTISNYTDPGFGILDGTQIVSNAPVASGSNSLNSTGNSVVVYPDVCTTTGGCLDPTTGITHTQIVAGTKVLITKPNGSKIVLTLSTDATDAPPPAVASYLTFEPVVYGNSTTILDWHNCYSFGNGVESNRIRDAFNLQFITNGVVASSTIDNVYEEEHRKYGLIYSGVYNANSNINETNQFISAEKITKDINPIYGSIQKLHTRDTDLVTLCEDKVLKILANKDAVFNADGNPQLTANERVLGQTVPFVGEYGISKNPESFASESYRAYFTDKVRGTVMRLSMDGLTPISNHGMKDWFRDNLKLSNKLLGSYDDKKDEYNITLYNTEDYDNGVTVSFKEDVKGWVSFKSFVPEHAVSCANEYYTFQNAIPFKHHVEMFEGNVEINRNTFYTQYTPSEVSVIINDIPGSVKSFTTINYEGSEAKITQNLQDDQYFNLQERKGWYVNNIKTNKEAGDINEFIEKEGKWFNYIKGKDVQVVQQGHDSGHILTPFSNVVGENYFDQASFAIQGLGISGTPVVVNTNPTGCTDSTAINYDATATIDDGSCIMPVLGCTYLSANNYNFLANVDDGSCIWSGCTCNSATYPNGCTNTTSFPSNAYSITDDGSCISVVYGCTDPNATNYDPTANTDDGSCVAIVDGCTIASADNYNAAANNDNGTCIWSGCTDATANNTTVFPAEANNYNATNNNYGIQDDGSCTYTVGCMDQTAQNYDPTATTDDGNSCFYCSDITTADGSYDGVPFTIASSDETQQGLNNGQISIIWNTDFEYFSDNNLPGTFTITNSSGFSQFTQTNFANLNGFMQGNSVLFELLAPDTYTISINVTSTPGLFCSPMIYSATVNTGGPAPVGGCMDPTMCNYNPSATFDNGSCEMISCLGCMDTLADNYNIQTNSTQVPQPYCTLPDGTTTSNCTLDCNGDPVGTNNSGWDSCCTYTVYGCSDPTAFNYYGSVPANTTLIDDGSCVAVVNGCTDPQASNYDPTANVDDGSCVYPQPVSGCTDPNACNYNPGATLDCLNANINGSFYNQNTGWDSCCYKGFEDVYVGSPAGPEHYLPGTPSPSDKEQHYIGPPQTSNSMWDSSTAPAGLPQLALPSDWSTYSNVRDIGLTWTNHSDFSSVSPSDFVKMKLWKKDLTTNTWTAVKSKSQNNLSSLVNGVFGNRSAGYPPWPFGNAMGSSNNYEFDVYDPTNQSGSPSSWTKAVYGIELYFDIGGTVYGDRDTSNPTVAVASNYPNCGHWHEFTFTSVGCANAPGNALPGYFGCTDPAACNHDPGATCDDASCYYPPVGYWACVNSGPPSFNDSCQPAGCNVSGSGTLYMDLASCQSACGNS